MFFHPAVSTRFRGHTAGLSNCAMLTKRLKLLQNLSHRDIVVNLDQRYLPFYGHTAEMSILKHGGKMKAILGLKERLTDNRLLVQNEGGYVSTAGFVWREPIDDQKLSAFEKEKGIALPAQYIDFLKISNGALLFEDIEYGQWGCEIFPLESIIAETEKVIAQGWNLNSNWIVFAKWRGDCDLFVFDLNRYSGGEKNYILDGDEGSNSEEWVYIKGDFDTWLDRLIVAQGAKYWRWY